VEAVSAYKELSTVEWGFRDLKDVAPPDPEKPRKAPQPPGYHDKLEIEFLFYKDLRTQVTNMGWC
jgi:hypothetical protein